MFLPKTMNVFSTYELKMTLLLFLLDTIHWILIFMEFWMFILRIILYKKVVAMWSPFGDHIRDHIKTSHIVCNNEGNLPQQGCISQQWGDLLPVRRHLSVLRAIYTNEDASHNIEGNLQQQYYDMYCQQVRHVSPSIEGALFPERSW